MNQIILAALLVLLAGCTATAKTESPRVQFTTSEGTFTVQLDAQAAPATVQNFLAYVDAGHYDGTVFHRVIEGFMIQGGGFTAEGTQKATNTPIKLEASRPNDRGTIAMARTSIPNSATSQFFVNLVDNDFLNPAPGNPGYAVFGEVVEGMDVVDAIGAKATGSRGGQRDWPLEDVTIISARRT